MGQYLPVAALVVLAVVFAALSLVASKLLAPRRTTVPKRAPYECGIVPGRDAPERFPVRFYLVAMIFIVFDIEIIFLYPWAVNYRNLGVFGLVEVVLFAVAVVVSLLYLVSKGALEWGPAKRVEPTSPMVSAERTASTTVRRVGLEGRLPEPPRKGVAA
ncbi:MAG: NADH-quinone oxidoreductase subunit A [Acidimicrobiales bacterium]